MGEKADEVLNGDMCQYCGQMFLIEGEGYPRTCHACIEDGIDVPPEDDNEKGVKHGIS